MTRQDALDTIWPLFGLRLKTPSLLLRLGRDEELAFLAKRAHGNVVSHEERVFMGEWTQLPSPQFERNLLQYHWRARADWRPEEWNLQLTVLKEGEPVGVMGLEAREFPRRRSVSTGSWLLREHQRQGYGTEMRAAVLTLAFEHLGALEALTGAHEDNRGSHGVNRRLGYRPNGERRDVLGGEGVRTLGFRLARDDWRSWPGIEVLGLDAACLELFGVG